MAIFAFCSIWKLWGFVSSWIRTHDLPHRSPISIPLYQISLIKKFQKIFKMILGDFWRQWRQLDRTTIGNFFWKDKKQDLLITFDINHIFAWNFQDLWGSTLSTIFHWSFWWGSCLIKKVNHTNLQHSFQTMEWSWSIISDWPNISVKKNWCRFRIKNMILNQYHFWRIFVFHDMTGYFWRSTFACMRFRDWVLIMHVFIIQGTVIGITQPPPRDGASSFLFSKSALDNYG